MPIDSKNNLSDPATQGFSRMRLPLPSESSDTTMLDHHPGAE
jgi:hypothetical protein